MNPFKVIFPENMKDEQIQSLFVSEMTNIDNVMNENHHIVWGSRGAGKSMLFRYMYSKNPHNYSDLTDDYCSNQHFNIYLKIRHGTLNVKEYLMLEEAEAISISEHMLNMLLTQAFVAALKKVDGIPITKLKKYVDDVAGSIYDYRITDSIGRANMKVNAEEDPLSWLHQITVAEIYRISDYFRHRKIGEQYEGAYTGYHDYVYMLFSTARECLGLKTLKFFILVDDAGNMYPFQQRIINNWIANRDHDLLTVKISATKNDYVCFSTTNDFSIDPVHDYSETDLDVIRPPKEKYKKRIADIITKRFETFGLEPISPYALYPDDIMQETLKEECRRILEERYNSIKPTVSLSVYQSRHLMPLVFQKLNETGRNYSYSGFENLVNLSSGIVRNFIMMSAEMWDLTTAEKGNEVVTSIPATIQTAVAKRQAESFLDNLSIIYRDNIYSNRFQKSTRIDFSIVNKLRVLLQSLGEYYRKRLLAPDLSEQIIFSFSISDPSKLSDELRVILDLATSYSYLQQSTVTGKNSGIREELYILNRKLSPYYRIYTGALKGRVFFSASDLQLAITSVGEFLKRTKPQSRSIADNEGEQISMFVNTGDNAKVIVEEEGNNEVLSD